MSSCRFMYENFITGPGDLSVSSAQTGLVGSPAPQALGSAVCYADGEHTGAQDQVFTVEIDSISAGSEVGAASFRWKRASSGVWEASGLTTTSSLTTLTDGVKVKWVSGAGQDFYVGDAWHILAVGSQGTQALMDRDRDTAWRTTGCGAEQVTADLGAAQNVKSLVLADHNLSAGATATLKASGIAHEPVWEFDPSGGALETSDSIAGTNGRATPRSYIDGGVVKYAADGESCFEDGLLSISPAVANLLSNSESFDNAGSWNEINAAVTADQTTAPDGSSTADKVVDDATNDKHQLISANLTLDDDTDYVFSVFAKNLDRRYIALALVNKANSYEMGYFDLQAGAVGGKDVTVETWAEPIGNGWYRCSLKANSGSGAATPNVRIYLADQDPGTGHYYNYSGDGSGLYLWGAQLTASPVPLPYAPNPGRNIFESSNLFSDGYWPKVRSTVSGDKISENTDTGTHGITKSISGLSDSTDFVLSIMAKAAERSWLRVSGADKASSFVSGFFNLATGSIGTVTADAAWIEDAGDGWYRCTVRFNSGAGASDVQIHLGICTADNTTIYTGDGSSGLLIQNAQLERGSSFTSYVPKGANGESAADAISFAMPDEVGEILSVEQPPPASAYDESSGAVVVSTVDGTAFVMPDDGSGANISPYAGTHVIKLVDSAGKVAWGYLSDAGSGETLGSELITNGTFDGDISGWTDGSTGTCSIGWNAGGYLEVSSDGSCYARAKQQLTFGAGYLIKYTWTGTSIQPNTNRMFIGLSAGAGQYVHNVDLADGTYDGYFTASQVVAWIQAESGHLGGTFDDISAKQVTAPPATGCSIVSTPGGSTQNFAYIDSGFDPNDIASYDLYPISEWRSEGTLVAEWTPGYDWDEMPAVAYHGVVSCSDASLSVLSLRKDASAFRVVSYDGVVLAEKYESPVAGTAYVLGARWGQSNQYQAGEGDGWGSAGAFDGAFNVGSNLNFGYGVGLPFHLGRVKIFSSWLDAEPRTIMSPWDYPDYSQTLSITSPHLVYFLDESYRYWRLELADASNSDGLIKASLIYLGGYFQPQRTFAASYGRATMAGRRMTASDAGKLAGSAQGLAQGLTLNFARLSISDAELFEAMTEAIHQESNGQINPVFFTAFSDTPADTLYCLPDADLNRQQAPGGRWDLSLNLKEVVKTDV